MRTPRLPAVHGTDTPADVNGLVRFAERPNLVSARVPSRSERAIPELNYTGAITIGTRDRRQEGSVAYRRVATVDTIEGVNVTCSLARSFG